MYSSAYVWAKIIGHIENRMGAAAASTWFDDAEVRRICELDAPVRLVIAMGYADCVAYISEDGISVAVASPEGGMQQADVAVIADIVMSQTQLELTQIRVVEV